MIKIKAILLLFATVILAACSSEKLNETSVIDEGRKQIATTELDKWILENITIPYGIEVVYRWEKNAGSAGSYIYPPKLENVRKVLEAVRVMGLETYRLKETGGGSLSSYIYMEEGIQILMVWSDLTIRNSLRKRCVSIT